MKNNKMNFYGMLKTNSFYKILSDILTRSEIFSCEAS